MVIQNDRKTAFKITVPDVVVMLELKMEKENTLKQSEEVKESLLRFELWIKESRVKMLLKQ